MGEIGGAIARVDRRDVVAEGVERRALSRERGGGREQGERYGDDRSQSFAARRHCSAMAAWPAGVGWTPSAAQYCGVLRSEEHTSELQSHSDLVCRLLLE